MRLSIFVLRVFQSRCIKRHYLFIQDCFDKHEVCTFLLFTFVKLSFKTAAIIDNLMTKSQLLMKFVFTKITLNYLYGTK